MSETPGSRALSFVARIWSLASIAFVLVFLFGEGLTVNGHGPTLAEWIALAFWPGGVLVGLVIAWFRERLGGAIAVGSLLAFYVCLFVERGAFPGGPYFLLVAAPGFLFLLSSLLSRPSQQMRHA